ncbi:hypothetical protein cypCar_00028282, partial [Cyprinus carpio]
MPEVPCGEPKYSDNTPKKRKREDVDDFSENKKSRWGILISQGELSTRAMAYSYEWLDVPWGDGDLGSWADRSPLHEAACQGRLLALKTLLSQGYSANIITIDHVTPLHEACLGDHVACARALIEAGAS